MIMLFYFFFSKFFNFASKNSLHSAQPLQVEHFSRLVEKKQPASWRTIHIDYVDVDSAKRNSSYVYNIYNLILRAQTKMQRDYCRQKLKN